MSICITIYISHHICQHITCTVCSYLTQEQFLGEGETIQPGISLILWGGDDTSLPDVWHSPQKYHKCQCGPQSAPEVRGHGRGQGHFGTFWDLTDSVTTSLLDSHTQAQSVCRLFVLSLSLFLSLSGIFCQKLQMEIKEQLIYNKTSHFKHSCCSNCLNVNPDLVIH